jgi:alginate O-acetyltransferase complex protein AlgI
MLFNSSEFLFVFLPVVVIGYHAMRRLPQLQLGWLVVASLVFYTSWSAADGILLIGTAFCNYLLYVWICSASDVAAGRILTLGVGLNLLFLAYFKYSVFVASTISDLFGLQWPAVSVSFPLGISFYTFMQIAFLVEARVRALPPVSPLRFACFSTHFAYITAGPLVQPSRMFSALDERHVAPKGNEGAALLLIGITMFLIGLFKKVVIADPLDPYTSGVFSTAAAGYTMGAEVAWLGVGLYAVQLYFDFSGYTDMALGIGLMLGLRLPLNFNSPLRATSIVEFWQRWHITMTQFFTNYLYSPLATRLSRFAASYGISEVYRTVMLVAVPTVVTFVVAGLWHGPSWTYVVFGLINGFALAINQLWRTRHRAPIAGSARVKRRVPTTVFFWLLTQVTFIVSMAFFRAPDLSSAGRLLTSMFGQGSGATIVAGPPFTSWVGVWVAVVVVLALSVPEASQRLMAQSSVGPATGEPSSNWHLNWKWLIVVTALAISALSMIGGPSPFLYYQF